MSRSSQPIDESARARLRQAQQEEAAALREVAAAQRRHENAQTRLEALVAREQATVDRAAWTVLEAQRKLVASSGVERAATLLDESAAILRRKLRRSTADRAPTDKPRST